MKCNSNQDPIIASLTSVEMDQCAISDSFKYKKYLLRQSLNCKFCSMNVFVLNLARKASTSACRNKQLFYVLSKEFWFVLNYNCDIKMISIYCFRMLISIKWQNIMQYLKYSGTPRCKLQVKQHQIHSLCTLSNSSITKIINLKESKIVATHLLSFTITGNTYDTVFCSLRYKQLMGTNKLQFFI